MGLVHNLRLGFLFLGISSYTPWLVGMSLGCSVREIRGSSFLRVNSGDRRCVMSYNRSYYSDKIGNEIHLT